MKPYPDMAGYTRVYPGIPGGGPGRFVSNVLARVLIFINLRGVELGAGPGEGVKYYKELRIKVKAKAKVKVRVKVKVRFSREAIRGSRSRSLA